MRKGSIKRFLGWSVASLAVTGFVATGAFAEQPSHQVTRPPRVDVQHPHAPHAVHKPHPQALLHPNDHPPQVIHTIAPVASSTVIHYHKNVTVNRTPRPPRPPRKQHVVTIVQVNHTKTIKVH
jgi:hypothetical protein